MKIASESNSNISEPMIFFELETMSSIRDNSRNSLIFQMNQQEVNNLYNNMKKIKDQLNLLVNE